MRGHSCFQMHSSNPDNDPGNKPGQILRNSQRRCEYTFSSWQPGQSRKPGPAWTPHFSI